MINRSRIAYKDYLGEETVTETKVLVEGTLSEQGPLTLKDSSFTRFVVGEEYEVTIDGTTQTLTAISNNGVEGITNVINFENLGENYFVVGVNPKKGQPICMAVGSYVGKTISISQTKTTTTKKYDIKKVPQELIPDTIARSAYVAKVKTKADDAFNKADAAQAAADTAKTTATNAQNTANAAQNTAGNAQNTANAAQNTAENAQTTAENAQNTANTAKTAAESAKIDPISYNYCAALFSKYRKFVGWYKTMPILEYNETLGSFYRSVFETTPLKCEDIPFNNFICENNFSFGGSSSKRYILFLTIYNYIEPSAVWGVRGFAIEKQGDTFYVESSLVGISTGEGLFLKLLPKNHMIMNSSTPDSTKKFEITVDDTGTLSAAEVTG